MTVGFTYPLPWWLAITLVAAAAVLGWAAYRRPLVALAPRQRWLLSGLRALTLVLLVLLLFRPFGLRPPAGPRDSAVAILVDASRSMSIADTDAETRFDEAASLVSDRLVPALRDRFATELFTFGDRLAAGPPGESGPSARHSDLAGALEALAERDRGRPVAAVVVVSDGGATGEPPGLEGEGGPPVFTIGVGDAEGLRDREVASLVAGAQSHDESSVDLRVSVVSRGFERDPVTLQLTANGQLLETRTVAPAADGSPVDAVFTVAPDPVAPTVYTIEIPAAEGERVAENNARSVLVSPAGRKRRVLAIEGAPGFEHSFLARALGHDPGLEVDTVVRKGRNAEGEDTFFVQAASNRSSALAGGFPETREDLYRYDAIVLANLEADFFTRAQLVRLSEFVSGRGGGLLVLGGRSFSVRGFAGTPLDTALPVELNDRRGGLVLPEVEAGGPPGSLLLTPEGERHPIMRLGPTADENRRRWAEMPTLAGVAALGGPRPGASLLAVSSADGGILLPLVAVQRYGQGRSMVFAGEGSWRWRMLLPSSDRRYELFWRQAARWLAGGAPDPVAVTVPAAVEPGDGVTIEALARTAAFAPAPDAVLEATLAGPAGDSRPLALRRIDEGAARFAGGAEVPQAGLYRVRLEARRNGTSLGEAEAWFYAGGADREFADPRLNQAVLARLATSSGGRYVPASDAGSIVPDLMSIAPPPPAPERYDLWQHAWVFALVVGLLSAEWVLRRRWGLR